MQLDRAGIGTSTSISALPKEGNNSSFPAERPWLRTTNAILQAIEQLEQAADALEGAINSHDDADLKAKLKNIMPKLQEVIGRLNDQLPGQR